MTDERYLATYDVVVVGGGAAGLSGALTLGRARRSVLVIDAGEPRNAPASGVHGFLTRDGMNPAELLEAGRAEVHRYGAHVLYGRVISAAAVDSGFTVELEDGERIGARRLLVATGLVDELPDVPGIPERWGRDVLHCPYCHGWEFRDQRIGVLATGAWSVHQALMFRQWTANLTLLLHDGPRPTDDAAEQLAAREIPVVEGEVTALEVVGDRLAGVRLRGGGSFACEALAVLPRFVARAGMLDSLGLKTVTDPKDMGEQIEADATGLTAVPGVWVAGNVADINAQAVDAAGAGVRAAAAINADLVEEEILHAVRARQDRASTAAGDE
ncbi:MAG: NAD(P)/FAD-dependent oxidoreductase [Rubrobacteraceae bacterium]